MLHFCIVEHNVGNGEQRTEERMIQCGKDAEQERTDPVVHRTDRGPTDRTAEADHHRNVGEVLEAEEGKLGVRREELGVI